MEDPKETVTGVERAEKKTLIPFEFVPLKLETREMRFLVLPPHQGDPNKPLECFFSYESLETCEPYTAVINARGNPRLSLTLSIDGFGKRVMANIIVFLKHIRTEESTLRLWFRDCCLNFEDPEEKSHYWTQEWMQTMSTHASNIVDLSELMAALWDKGELLRPFAPRLREWPELRKPNAPKHHPMPIGSWRGWEAPPTPLQHLPLDYVADEIRLVELWSAQDKFSPLVAPFAYTPMHDGTVYYALSYTWGEGEATRKISLNGQIFFIRKTLDDCLRAIRSLGSDIVIWIDAICIDQNNIQEKNRQIPRMLEIYEAAEVVLSWVGEPDDASKEAFALIKDDVLKTPKLQKDSVGNWKVKDLESFPKLLASLYRFLLRPYFRRVWVIQELAASNHSCIMCGEDMIAWSDLDQASSNLIDILHRDDSMSAKMMEADLSLKDVSNLELFYVRRLSYFRHLRTRGSEDSLFGNQIPQIKDDSPGILDAVVLARDFRSTSPYDKIFAVWNLAQDTDGMEFKLDYSRSLSHTFLEFAVEVAKKNYSLDIICAAEPFTRQGLTLPSWCPDWTTASTVSSMVRREFLPSGSVTHVRDMSGPLYSAAGPLNLIRRFSVFETTLECAGAIYDSIRLLGPYEANFDNTQDTFVQWLTIVDRELGSDTVTWIEMMGIFWSMLAGDVAGIWGVTEVEACEGSFDIKCLKHRQTRYQDHWNPRPAYRAVTRGRRLVITANGFMGLAPWYAEEGQELAILSGCSAPVLLHENNDGTYRFIGSCFVQGWMEGEMLEFYGSTAEEAWDSIEAQGRLKIV